ncbi:TDP-N-acetylfucosamine:lipid II N-acetylfucosaminyltransferase [Porticoccaceae bacterium]|nr:TDP-N-acetylfucosamine:lipid II N-acetylfucosaminyltransferase [Porticoccaceae bacterium]
MILHIAPDEKFINIAMRIFENAKPECNDLVIVSNERDLSFVKETLVKKSFSKRQVGSDSFYKFLMGYEAIVIHCFSQLNMRFPIGVKVAWIGWGADYYDLIYNSTSDLLDVRTKELVLSLNKSKDPLLIKIIRKLRFIEPLIRHIRKRFKLRIINNNIDFFLPVLPNEFTAVSENCNEFCPKFLDWNYGTLESDWLKGYEKSSCYAENILIGNSAAHSNNHLEAFDLIKNFNLKERKVLCPLSYGDKKYRDVISEKGYCSFGKCFEPMLDFMPLNMYISKISSCSFVIMNHLRQQGLGNVVIMMHLGAKVFLKKKNPIYSFLKQKGAAIFTIEDLKSDPSLLNEPLCSEEREKNREVLHSVWSEKVIIRKTKVLLDNLLVN